MSMTWERGKGHARSKKSYRAFSCRAVAIQKCPELGEDRLFIDGLTHAMFVLNLATDFTAWPSRAVNVYISGASTNRADQFIKFASADTSLICQVSNIRRHDGARYRCGGRWTRLRSCRSITEVSAEEHADGTSHALLSKMNMSLLDSTFKVVVAKFPLNTRFI